MSDEMMKAVGLTIWGFHKAGYRSTTQVLILQMLATTTPKVGLTVQEVMTATGCSQGAANKTFLKLTAAGLARKNVSEARYEYFGTEQLRALFGKFTPVGGSRKKEEVR
jgi:DNA-binding transcriptional regulator GbsR (MarR family)